MEESTKDWDSAEEKRADEGLYVGRRKRLFIRHSVRLSTVSYRTEQSFLPAEVLKPGNLLLTIAVA